MTRMRRRVHVKANTSAIFHLFHGGQCRRDWTPTATVELFLLADFGSDVTAVNDFPAFNVKMHVTERLR